MIKLSSWEPLSRQIEVWSPTATCMKGICSQISIAPFMANLVCFTKTQEKRKKPQEYSASIAHWKIRVETKSEGNRDILRNKRPIQGYSTACNNF